LHSALVKLGAQLTLTNLGLTEASVAATAASGKASVLSVGLVGVASAAALVIGWNIGHWLRELYVNATEAAKQVDILSQKMQVMVSTSAKTVSLIEGVKSGFIGEKYFTNNISQFEKKIQELKQLQNEMSLEDIYKEDSKYYVYKDQINEYTESIKNLNYVKGMMFSKSEDELNSFNKMDRSLVETAKKNRISFRCYCPILRRLEETGSIQEINNRFRRISKSRI